MRRLLTGFWSICLLLSVNIVSAQEHQYFYITYIKLKDPSKASLYLDLLQQYGKPVCDFLLKEKKIKGWFAYQCIMPSGVDNKYDFAVVTFSPDMQTILDDTTNIAAVFKNVFPSVKDDELKDVFSKYDSARNIISTEVFDRLAFANNLKRPSLYAKVNFMKTLPGMDSAYIYSEENDWMKLHKEGMKMNLMTDWELDKKLLPVNIANTYNYLSVDFYNSVNAMFDERYFAAFHTIWTNDEAKKVSQDTNNSRVFVSSEIWKLITFSN